MRSTLRRARLKRRPGPETIQTQRRFSPDGREVWVTNQGGGSVSVFQAGSLAKVADLAVGKQPVALLFSADGKRLYVANSGSNSVSVVDTAGHGVRQTIRTALFPQSPTGSTPNALALSPDGKTLFVTNADNNDVAVVDVSHEDESRVLGFIPTGWYPTAVVVSPDGKKLFVGVGKGLGTGPSYPKRGGGMILDIYNKLGQSYGPRHDQSVSFDYISSLVGGGVSVIDMPNPAQLARYTAQVIAGMPLPRCPADPDGGAARAHDHSLCYRAALAYQACPLHHQGKSHLRSGVWRPGRRGRRSEFDAVWP